MIIKALSRLLMVGTMMGLMTASASAMTLSLNESITRALECDERIAAAESDTETARWNLSATRRQKGPRLVWESGAYKIGGEYYHERNRQHEEYGNEASPAYHNTFSNSVGISVPLYTGGELEGNIDSRKHLLHAANLTLEDTRREVRYSVVEAYYNVLQNRNVVEVNASAVDMVAKQLDLLQVQYEEGATAYSEVLQMQVQLANYMQNLTLAKSELKVAEDTLLSMIELPNAGELELSDPFFYEPFKATLNECVMYALDNRADLAAAEYNVNQAESSADATKAGYRPTVSGQVSKSIEGNGGFQQERSETWQAGVALSWSIFDNKVTSAQVHAAKSEVEKLKSSVDALAKSVELQVRSSYTQMKAAEANVKLMFKAVEQAQESYDIAVVRHSEGVDILLSVTDAQEKLTQAWTNYYTALYQYNLYRAQLDRAMGVPVEINVPVYVEAQREGKSAREALEMSLLTERG